MDSNLKITSGPAIEKPGEIAAVLNGLSDGDVLFIDEIHRLNRQVEEVLYPAMEDFSIDIMIGKGASAKSIRLDLPHFTLVGATTRAGMLTAPLRDRFGVVNRKSRTAFFMNGSQHDQRIKPLYHHLCTPMSQTVHRSQHHSKTME